MQPFDLAKTLNIPALPTHLAKVEQRLEQAAYANNSFIHEPLSRLLKKRGKRLRPALTIAIATAFDGVIDENVISACVAIELIHISSLIHDDIIDHADTRWNIPTINAREGVDRAILVGDYVFAKGCAEAASVNAKAAQITATAFTEICRGQASEMNDLHNLDRTEASLMQAITGKTSAMFAAACQLGGLCANASSHDLRALSDFGYALGASFQLVDDILNFVAEPELFGKPVGTDIREGNYTLPVILGLQSPERAEVLALLKKPDDFPRLTSLLLENGSIATTIAQINFYNQAAIGSLASFKDAEKYRDIAALPHNYSQWFLDSFTAEPYRAAVSRLLS